MKSTLASTDSPTKSVDVQAEASDKAVILLTEALSELDRANAGTAVRARLQGIIDELANRPADESSTR